MPQAKRWESYFRTAPSEPGDGKEGTWSRDRLLQMDARFTARMQRAIAHGKEHPATAKQNPPGGEGFGK